MGASGKDDRFSGLSDELAYHILSFLNVEDLGRLIPVSKRCKSLCVYVPCSLTKVDDDRCVSAPCLIVDNRNHAHDSISRQRFIQCVGNLLAIRANSGTNIRHFTLIWCFQGQGQGLSCPPSSDQARRRLEYPCDSEEALVSRWLVNLLSHYPERISINTLDNNGDGEDQFPSRLLSSHSLKHFSICCNSRVLRFPCFSSRPIYHYGWGSHLQSLTLQSARIVSDDPFTVALGMLVSLEYLYLYDCSGLKRISISNRSLKLLKIINGKPVDLYDIQVSGAKLQKFYLTWYPADSRRTRFLLSSPSLQDFVWYGYFVRYYLQFQDQSHLQLAYRTLPPGTEVTNVASCQGWSDLQCAALYLTLPPGTDVTSFASLSKYKHMQSLLPNFAKAAKLLRLHAKTIEGLFQLGHLTPQLNAVRNLAIDYCVLTDDQVPIIASFLKVVFRLETLYLMSSQATLNGSSDENLKEAAPPQGFRFRVEYWESRELTFVAELKKAAVEVHNDEGNDVELVKYLLKHAKGMENLTIVCAPSLASSILEQLNAFMKSPAKVNFCLRPQTN